MPSLGFVTDRHEHTAGVDRAAFSPNGAHRYLLTRRWASGPSVCWVMLNPSTASAFTDDPTCRRAVGFTKRLGSYGGLVIVNLYALRSTNPANLWTRNETDRIGPLGDQFLTGQATTRAAVIAAWGTHGARNGRGQRVAEALEGAGVELLCLGYTAGGQPKHPLYVKGDTPLVPYRVREVSHA